MIWDEVLIKPQLGVEKFFIIFDDTGKSYFQVVESVKLAIISI